VHGDIVVKYLDVRIVKVRRSCASEGKDFVVQDCVGFRSLIKSDLFRLTFLFLFPFLILQCRQTDYSYIPSCFFIQVKNRTVGKLVLFSIIFFEIV